MDCKGIWGFVFGHRYREASHTKHGPIEIRGEYEGPAGMVDEFRSKEVKVIAVYCKRCGHNIPLS